MQDKLDPLTDSHLGELLSAYIDGRLTPGERLRVETHLPACSACRAELIALQETITLLKGLPVVATPRPFYVYPEMVPARPSRFGLGALLRPGWAFGALRVATSLAAMLLVVVVAADALTLGF